MNNEFVSWKGISRHKQYLIDIYLKFTEQNSLMDL